MNTLNREIGLSRDEMLRYSRHISIPEVGVDGQLKLKNAKVLCIGAGGLGAPLGMYLAAAGVGTLGLVDFDTIDYSNLQRQVIYSTADVGKSKLQIAKERLQGINPFVELKLYETKLSSQNALEIFKDYDVIADGTDNFPTRYLVNDACVLLNKPNVYGSILRFDGQLSVFDAKRGPCYRCVFPDPPPPGAVPSCAEGGVLGVLPAIIGSLQALETIKLVLSEGESLIGRLVLFDALKMTFRELKLQKDPGCPICGPSRSITQLIDYEQFCGLRPEVQTMEPKVDQAELEVEEFKKLRDQKKDMVVLDVREPWEWDICHFPEAKLIPLKELPNRLAELDVSKDMVVHCRSGGRSAKAVELLRKSGFPKAKNLKGGITAWSDKIDPSVPKY